MLVGKSGQMRLVPRVLAGMFDHLQSAIVVDLQACSVIEFRSVIELARLFHLSRERGAADLPTVEILVPSGEILDRGEEARRAHGVVVGNAQLEAVADAVVGIRHALDDLGMIVPEMGVGHAERQENAIAGKGSKGLSTDLLYDLGQ